MIRIVQSDKSDTPTWTKDMWKLELYKHYLFPPTNITANVGTAFV